MRDEMAAGLLQYPTVTTNSLEKIIEHVSNSPKSPSNDHEQIPVHFVVPSSRPSKNNSVSLFLQVFYNLIVITYYFKLISMYVHSTIQNYCYEINIQKICVPLSHESSSKIC